MTWCLIIKALYQLARHTGKWALSVDVEVLDDDARCFPICPDRERDSAQPVSILSYRLVGEHVAIKMLHRKHRFLRPLFENQTAVFCGDLNLTIEIVLIGASVGSGRQSG